MSSDVPGPVGGSTPEPASPEVEYLGPEQTPRTRGSRKGALVAAATVGVVAVAGAGAWGLASFLSAGPSPATAVPADALGYVALDMDPSGSQKVEAWQMLRKFPALKDELGLSSGDDIRRWLFEGISSGMECADVTFADVDPWLGSKAAVAVVPNGDEEPRPFGVIQVKDEDKAEAGMAQLAECADGDTPGTAFVGDYMVVAETLKDAAEIAAAAEEGPLSDDDAFQGWMDAVGDPGIVTAYVSAEAPAVMMDQMSGLDGSMLGGEMMGEGSAYAGRAPALQGVGPGEMPEEWMTMSPEDWEQLSPEELEQMMSEQMSDWPTPSPGTDDEWMSDDPMMEEWEDDGFVGGGYMPPFLPMMPFAMAGGEMDAALEDFEGMAMVVRFADGALEGEIAMALPEGADALSNGSTGMSDLPASTVVALGLPTGDDWAETVLDTLREQVGEEEYDQGVSDFEAETGLSLPEDLQALVGDGISIAVDSSLDLSGMFSFDGSSSPTTFPIGVRIAGDPDEIRPVLDRLVETMGEDAESIYVEEGDGAVAVSGDPDHAVALAADGDLGESDGFEAAMEGMDEAAGAFFLDFDTDGWLAEATDLAEGGPDENFEPLSSMGFSARTDDDVAHLVFRLTTD